MTEDAELNREKVDDAGVSPSEPVLKVDSGGDAGEREGVDMFPTRGPWTEGFLHGRRFWVGGPGEGSLCSQGRFPPLGGLGDVAVEVPFSCGGMKGLFEMGMPSSWRN